MPLNRAIIRFFTVGDVDAFIFEPMFPFHLVFFPLSLPPFNPFLSTRPLPLFLILFYEVLSFVALQRSSRVGSWLRCVSVEEL